jgi:hypothetical protein
MSDTAKPQTLVHVLRHSFRPSEQLTHSLQEFIPPQSEHLQSSVTIKSLAKVALDSHRYRQHEFSLALIEAEKDVIRNRNISIPILEDMRVLKLTDTALKIVLRTNDIRSMYRLHRALKNRVPEDTSLPRNPNAVFLVTADLKSTVPFDDFRIKDAEAQYHELYTHKESEKLMNIFPEGLTGIDQYILTEDLDLST